MTSTLYMVIFQSNISINFCNFILWWKSVCERQLYRIKREILNVSIRH